MPVVLDLTGGALSDETQLAQASGTILTVPFFLPEEGYQYDLNHHRFEMVTECLHTHDDPERITREIFRRYSKEVLKALKWDFYRKNKNNLQPASESPLFSHNCDMCCIDENRRILLLPCGHYDACASCLEKWYINSQNPLRERICPSCMGRYTHILDIEWLMGTPEELVERLRHQRKKGWDKAKKKRETGRAANRTRRSTSGQ